MIRILLASLLLVSCGQDYNSNSGDVPAGGVGDCSTAAGQRLCAAYSALQNNHCFLCHLWSSYQTDAAWISSGLVSAGNPSGSTLVQRLQNAGGDMPQGYGPLSSSDYDAIRTWIQNL